MNDDDRDHADGENERGEPLGGGTINLSGAELEAIVDRVMKRLGSHTRNEEDPPPANDGETVTRSPASTASVTMPTLSATIAGSSRWEVD